ADDEAVRRGRDNGGGRAVAAQAGDRGGGGGRGRVAEGEDAGAAGGANHPAGEGELGRAQDVGDREGAVELARGVAGDDDHVADGEVLRGGGGDRGGAVRGADVADRRRGGVGAGREGGAGGGAGA